ncbi:MAG TPA: DUF559 domain-containing protein [Pseudolysinimonas sp.]|nr:DUF559 domain-containing protein [Pseudolysinimonas sp.]
MRRPVPIDPALGDVFAVHQALEAGVSRDRLGRRDLERPFHGVRTRGDVSAIRAYAPRLRLGDRFSYMTAARIWGAPVPRRFESDVHVSAARAVRPRARGCIGHATSTAEWVLRGGVPVSDPAQTILECATLLPLDDVVALCDFFVLDPHVLDPADVRPHISLTELGLRLRESRGLGVRAARRAHRLAREGVESPMETRLRLLLSRAGLPEPTCGFQLLGPDGSAVGWFDLAWPEHRVIAEYDGDQHRTSTHQYERDIRRFDDVADLGWRVIRVRRHGILSAPGATVARVARALA